MSKKGHRSTFEERLAAVHLFDDGVGVEVIATSFRVGRGSVYLWVRQYRDGGEEALRDLPTPGRTSTLSEYQLSQLWAWILESTPQRFGYEQALWTVKIAAEVLEQEFGIRLSRDRIRHILHDLGFSVQRPRYRAYQQDEHAAQVWQQQTYPDIVAQAEREGATVAFADEASVRSDHHGGSTWGVVGQTPVAGATGERRSVNMVSAVTTDGQVYFEVFTGRMNAETFVEFCAKLAADVKTPVFVIADQSRVHTARKVADYVDSTQGRLRLFFLPAYCPQLNPDEWVWRSVKGYVKHSVAMGTSHLWGLAVAALRKLQQSPALARGYFRDPALAYIEHANSV